ncbi:MAG: CPBP family intramembrane metalloprotease, partial [Chloroflexi bacterium]
AFNTYDPAFGFASLSWGWALSSSVAGLFFGLIREKTGTLLAPGIAHGLPDAVGEALVKVFGWM